MRKLLSSYALKASLTAFSILLTAGCSIKALKSTPPTPAEVFDQAVSIIEKNYVDVSGKPIKLDTTGKPDIGSLMSQLTYSVLLSPKEVKMLQNPFRANTGIEYRIIKDRLEIVGCFKDSPASRAGIDYKDEIIEIDNVSIEGLSVLSVTNMLSGPPGSEVSIKVMKFNGETRTYKLIREVIRVEDIGTERIITDGIGYIRIHHFDTKTPEKLKSAVKRLLKKGMSGLVLDMRNNEGGLLQAINESGQVLLASGKSIAKMVGNNSIQTFDSRGWSHYTDFPIAVLIDRNAASGAEIFSAALKENERAVLVGEKTLGSVAIRSIYPLLDESFLILRTHQIMTPRGKMIDGVGVTPDIEVNISMEEYNNLYGEVILNISNADNHETVKDTQLETAVSYLVKQIKPNFSNNGQTASVNDSRKD